MKLIKVILVDDEDIVIEDLKNLIHWEQKGFEIVGTATNGRKALDLYEKLQPELMIVDIKMPGMDGLELSRSILSGGRTVKILLLTAYRDFEYAKTAISMGISNYLLKHEINENSLMTELAKVKADLEYDRKKLSIIRQQVFRRVLEGEFPPGKRIEEREYLCDPGENFVLLLLQPDRPLSAFESLVPREELSFTVNITLDELDLPEFVSYLEWVDMTNTQAVLVISVRKLYSQRELKEKLHLFALALQKYICSRSKKTISIAITNTSIGLEGIPVLFHKARETLKRCVFHGRNKVYLHEGAAEDCNENAGLLREKLLSLEKVLQEGDRSEAEALLNEVFEQIVCCKDVEMLNLACSEIKDSVNLCLKNHQLPLIEARYGNDSRRMALWYAVNDIHAWFKQIFRELLQEIETVRNRGTSNKIRQVLLYIDKHYGEDLTLEKVAETLGFSRVYLGQLFKKETGRTFLDYLTRHRIETAKRMLSGGNYKIYEVAEKTGYKTSQYFSEVFRRVTGMNPLEYRDGVKSFENEH